VRLELVVRYLLDPLVARGSAVGVSVLCPGFVQTRIGESNRNAPASVAEWTETPLPRVT
jgi:short-subunit dehydrogenase